MSDYYKHLILIIGVACLFSAWLTTAKPGARYTIPSNADFTPPQDTIKKGKRPVKSRNTAPPKDRYGDPYSNRQTKSPLLLGNPSNISTDVEADSAHDVYTIHEKVGEVEYRPPSTMTFEEYKAYKNREMMQNYWRSKASGPLGEREDKTKEGVKSLKIPVRGLEGPFGSNFVDIKPNGVVTMDFGGRWQRVSNPVIPVRAQRNGGFEFDQQISMNVVGRIGEKLRLTANWDTKATFEFQNNIKLEYTGFEEDIIQKIEAGFVSMPVNSALISGAQNLFGIKTKLQFGRLSVTSVLSSQRGKVEEVRMQGGAQTRDFELKADQYDENRHFFLGNFFRNNYERSLQNLPVVASGVTITRVNVYITNRVNNTSTIKNIIAYLDLGEANPYRQQLRRPGTTSDSLDPANDEANRLTDPSGLNVYGNEVGNRDPSLAETQLRGRSQALFPTQCDTCFGQGTDFTIITSARQLLSTEFSFNPQLGFISLNTPITAQDLLAVSYEYTFTNPKTGKNDTYKVGELVGDKISDSTKQLIVLKMLKPIGTRPRLPTWNLMMKNIYQLGATQVTRDNFMLRLIYKDDSTGADTPFLQLGQRRSLLNLLGMDRLNPNNDPPADGNFDFIEGVTIDTRYGRIIFPTLEPFGQGLARVLPNESLRERYVFNELYRRQLADVRQVTEKNKFYIKGRFQSSSSSDIMLPGINIAPGSVTIFAGSTQLQESQYSIDYSMGRVKILDQGLLTSGQEIRIKYEKQDLFNFRRKTFVGTRFDYLVNKDINLGATVFHQKEAPQITRTSIGDEPSSNTIWGLDANVKKDSRFLTKVIDKLPIIQTKEVSTITFGGEVAQLLPGHPKVIDKNEGGTSFIDDFEGAETPYDLTRTPNRWKIATMPRISNSRLNASQLVALETQYQSPTLGNGFSRAKLAWYTIDNSYFYGTRIPKEIKDVDIKNKFVKAIDPVEIFPQYQRTLGQLNEPTLDLAYYPAERGPYNYNTNLTSEGRLPDPKMSWAAITRDLRQDIDFDNANIQYLEFWMLNPFFDADKNSVLERMPFNLVADDVAADPANRNKVPDKVKSAGRLYFNLGEISEDVIRDNEHYFENGLPSPGQVGAQAARQTNWGKVPTVQYTTNAFDASNGSREAQDVGLEGLQDEEERQFPNYQEFINNVNSRVTNTQVKDAILADPSADNYSHYLGDRVDDQRQSILSRYKNNNGVENNSPISNNNQFTPSNSNTPDNEDLNQDNTLNFTNNYYEYVIDIDPTRFVVGQNYIISKQDSGSNQYLQFRIPIRQPTDTVGSIEGYKSLRFLRMYLNGFEEPVILRMAKLQLVANQWRLYGNSERAQDLRTTGINPAEQGGTVTVSTVNVEENSGVGPNKSTSTYMTPPGFTRDQDITSLNNRQLNEQSLRLCVEDLKGRFSGSAFKNVNYNMLNYKRLRMFVHAESAEEPAYLKDDDLIAFVRVGTDYTQNYYEIEVPLKFTRPIDSQIATDIWRVENHINISLPAMAELKARRNGGGGGMNVPFTGQVEGRTVNILGNPDLSSVQILMIGIRNPSGSARSEHSACIWVNELRLTEFVEDAGWATTGQVNLKLADLANVTATGRYSSVGFGSIDQKVSQRALVNTGEWGVQGSMGLDKFLPTKLGLRLPLYAGYNARIISPKYNPLDPDVLLNTSINNIEGDERKKDYRKLVLDQQSIKSINLTNIQKVKTRPDAKSHFYDIENLTLSLGYNETKRSNVNIKEYSSKIYNAGVGYTYNYQGKPLEPFKNVKALDSPYLKLIKDLNFSLLPTTITVRGDLNRRLTKTQYWEGNPLEGIYQEAFYEKAFTFVRNYGMVWNLTKSITLNYTAISNAIVDEPDGEPEANPDYNKMLWRNVKKLGRSKNFTQAIGATYKVPFDKLPLTDWLNADLSYNGGYNWTAGANSQRQEFGNLLSQNTRDMGVNGRIALDRLYSKSKFLKDVNNPVPKPKVPVPVADTGKKEPPPPELKGLKAALRVLMSVKFVNFSYKVSEGTKIGGYKGTANILGVERNRPGNYYNHMLPFVFGWQDPNIRFKLWEDSLISKSLLLNDQFAYNKSENFTASTQLEPLKDFTVKLNVSKSRNTDYRELFHISYEDPARQQYAQDAPLSTGSYNISIIAIKSAFLGKVGSDRSSSVAFQNFVESRESFRSRRAALNPNTQGERDTLYSLNSQDVLIPAFLNAYLGKDPAKADLKVFPTIPLPNWNINFTGLNRIPALKKKFQSITLTHAYVSTFAVSSYTSSLLYNKDLTKINPQGDPNNSPFPDSIKNNRLVPVYTIDVVSIRESFSPLLGVSIRTKGRASYNINYLKDRSMILSMANSQMQETQSNGVTVGFAWTKTNFKIPFKWQGRAIPPLKNELVFKADLTVRDNKTVQRNIGGVSTVTAGLLTLQFRPTISYMVSQRLNLTFYFDRQVSVPYISSSFRRGVTAFGIQLRFTLS